jgi:hypothetical protein
MTLGKKIKIRRAHWSYGDEVLPVRDRVTVYFHLRGLEWWGRDGGGYHRGARWRGNGAVVWLLMASSVWGKEGEGSWPGVDGRT